MMLKNFILLVAISISGYTLLVCANSAEYTWAVDLRKYSIRINADYTYEETKEETTLIRSQSLIDAFDQAVRHQDARKLGA